MPSIKGPQSFNKDNRGNTEGNKSKKFNKL